MTTPETSLIPSGMENYFEFGCFDKLLTIVKSGEFFPTYLAGPQRGGKTTMVHQVCHVAQRELIHINFTEQTEEEDLMECRELIDGNTVSVMGPVPIAMERGAILLFDEIDQATYKCMCLQRPMENQPVYLKKLRKTVYPKSGFNVIATGNTKGQGDQSGKFGGTQLLNEAFLDRFSITFEHNYPPAAVEEKILFSYLNKNNRVDNVFVTTLIRWAGSIRKNYYENNITSDLISTGRLIHIVKAYRLFPNPFEAVKMGISRFDEHMKGAFYSMFTHEFPFEEKDFEGDGKGIKAFIKRATGNMDLDDLNVTRKSR